MIFRTLTDADGNVTVSVEEDDTVLFTLAATDRREAAALVRKGVFDGIEAIRPVDEPEVAKLKKKT
jgi:hypothetical protein